MSDQPKDTSHHPMAPGCFGSPSVYSADSRACRACPAFNACGPAAMTTLQAIRGVIDVSDLLRQHAQVREAVVAAGAMTGVPVRPLPAPVARKTARAKVDIAISDDDLHVIARLASKNTKTADQATILCKQSKIAQLRADLPLGINPFAQSSPSFMRVAVDVLIDNGGFTKAGLNTTLCARLGWSSTTAASHVAIACALLYAFGFIVAQADGAFVLAPSFQRSSS